VQRVSRSEIISGNVTDLFKGLGGGSVTILAAITGHLEALEFWLRCLVHVTGFAVGVVTIWSIIKRSRRN